MLARHPDIFMSPIKEPHYFSSIKFPFPEHDILQVTKDPTSYRKLFRAARTKLSGESSAFYLADPAAPAKIKAYNPDMKLIAILREPIERAHSHYLLYNRRGAQPQTFYERVKQLVEEGGESLVYNIVELGKYGSQLANYRRYFPAEQLLILSFNDLRTEPQATLEKVLVFLGADKAPAAALAAAQAQNGYQVPRNKLFAHVLGNLQIIKWGLRLLPRKMISLVRNNFLLKEGKKEVIDARAMALLKSVYEPEIIKVQELMAPPPASSKTKAAA